MPMLSIVCNFILQAYIIYRICKILAYKEICPWVEYKASKLRHHSKDWE